MRIVESSALRNCFKARLHSQFFSQQLNKILSRRSCNQLRFHRDFNAICGCKHQAHAVCLIKSETTTQNHRVYTCDFLNVTVHLEGRI